MSSAPASPALAAWASVHLVSPRINLTFSLRDISGTGSLGKTNPMVVVCTVDEATGQESVIGRSDFIKDVSSACDFHTGVELDFFFERSMLLRFIVYNIKSEEHISDLSKQQVIGVSNITLGEVIGSPHASIRRAVMNDKQKQVGQTSIVVRAQTRHGDDDRILRVRFNGRDLSKKDVMGKSDPFFELYHLQRDGHSTLVYKSEVINNNLNPNWAPVDVNLIKLVDGDLDKKFLIKVWDWDAGSSNDSLGECKVSVNELTNSDAWVGELKGEKGKAEGNIQCEKADIAANPTIADYLAAGTKIQFAVAIDFTGSNGDPRKPETLHYRQQGLLNQYQRAMKAFGQVLLPYDSDQKILAWGFGAKLPGSTTVSHCFPLNLDETDPQVSGLQGLEAAYEKAFSKLTLSGPTHFNEIITQAAGIIGKAPETTTDQSYMILLILTDGEIQDMDLAIEALIDASELPLSVVIAGVGEADFASMVELDADHGTLKLGKKKASRDIVQFVPFSKFENDGEKLAQATLYEVPKQFLTFMKSKGLLPIKSAGGEEEKKH